MSTEPATGCCLLRVLVPVRLRSFFTLEAHLMSQPPPKFSTTSGAD